MDFQKQIEEILQEFDFEKVHEVMDFLKWKWIGSQSESHIPTVAEIKEVAKKLLTEVSANNFWDNKNKNIPTKYYWMGSGGFVARRVECIEGIPELTGGKLSLEFVISEWDAEYEVKDIFEISKDFSAFDNLKV